MRSKRKEREGDDVDYEDCGKDGNKGCLIDGRKESEVNGKRGPKSGE